MSRYFINKCDDQTCPVNTEKWMQGTGSHLFLFEEGGEWFGKCEKCGTTNKKPTPARTFNLKKKTYPEYNASVGVTFESESHEKAYVKMNNLTEA